ncbi:MAG: polysaccharide deacetylase family protein, partial [Nocardioides sp.]
MRRPLTGLVLTGALLAAALGGPAPGPAAATVPASTAVPAACPAPAAGTLFRTPATSPRTVALTFDDGPGPWTPYVLTVLRRERVHATFFVTGTHVT